MYVDIGMDLAVRASQVLGVFDLDNTSWSKRTREFLQRAQEDGCTRLVAVLTQHAAYRKKKSRAQAMLRIVYGRKYPQLVEALGRRHTVYNEQLDYAAEQEKAGSVYLIRPTNPVAVGRMERNPEKIRALYQIGYLDGKANAARVKAFLREEDSP